MSAIVWVTEEEHKTLWSTEFWLQMVWAVLSDGLLFTLPPPGLTVSTCKGQEQRPLSWCVFTCLADSERSPQLEKWGQGAPLPITNTLAVSLNPPKEESVKNLDKPITFAYGPHHPDTVSLLKVFLNLFIERENRTDCGWIAAVAQPSGEVASGNLFSHRLGLQALPLNTGDQLQWDRGVLLWGYWLLSKFT